MTTYTFDISGERRTVEADDLDEAMEKAGIGIGDVCELVEPDDFEDSCLLSVITDEILFGS